MPHIRFGIDRLADRPGLPGSVRRLGMVTNDAARPAADPERLGREALLAAGLPIVRLFTPEHGLGADAPDGAPVGGATDPRTALPVVSLYGATLGPPAEALADLDGVLCDLPDIGIRCYTYIWTLTYVIDACAAAGIPVWVLDRPNPLGGAVESVEGPIIEPEHASFIGRHTLPVRHSLTAGEFARLWQRERRPEADVRLVECDGWRRDTLWPESGLPFIPTSPAIRRFEAALLYGGLCLFEATNVSAARGTALSFEAVGAPWLDAAVLADRFAARRHQGIAVETTSFVPGTGPHAGGRCEGVRIIVREPAAVRPVALGLALLADVAAVHAGHFAWADYPSAANPAGTSHLERLSGTARIRATMDERPGHVDEVTLAEWTAAPGWADRWRGVRIYA